MSEKKGIDLNNLKFVDASEVPAKVRYTPYREMLKRIKKGKALILTDKEANLRSVRAGVIRMQHRGEFKKLRTTERLLENGEHVLYIVYPSDEETEKHYRRVEKSEDQQPQ
jgi:hypothetical protein